MTEQAGVHPEGLTIIQEVGPGQYNRHRQDLPGDLGAHYSQSHDRTILPDGTLHSHVGPSASLADINVAAHPAHIGPSGRL